MRASIYCYPLFAIAALLMPVVVYPAVFQPNPPAIVAVPSDDPAVHDTIATQLAANSVPDTAAIAPPPSKLNALKFNMHFLTHGEICAGGLPRTTVTDDGTEDGLSAFLLGRLRLIVGYERQRAKSSEAALPLLEARAVVQNIGVWGSNSNMALALNEGWVRMNAKCGIFAQIGRVALSYDDERIIGPNDFAMASLSHDILRLGYEGHGHSLHALLAFNQVASHVYKDTYYDGGSQHYKTMQTLWYHYDLPKFPLGASLLFMNIGMQAGEKDDINNQPFTAYQQLIGGYLNYHPRRLTIEAAYYHQLGKTVNIEKSAVKLDAWMASVKATFQPTDRYGFQAGYDYLSGDNYVSVPKGGNLGMVYHSVERGFNPLYGSRTKFYGIMDYFYQSAYINGFTPGLQNAYVGFFGKPLPKMECRATYHYLAVATKLVGLGSTLGHSIDIQAHYQFMKEISLTAGYTLMHGTETMNRLKQGSASDYAHWGWFSLIVSPSLFTAKF